MGRIELREISANDRAEQITLHLAQLRGIALMHGRNNPVMRSDFLVVPRLALDCRVRPTNQVDQMWTDEFERLKHARCIGMLRFG